MRRFVFPLSPICLLIIPERADYEKECLVVTPREVGDG